MPSQEESQLKLHLKTSLSKLQYKLSKSRILSNQTLQTKIVPNLKDLKSLSTPATEDEPEPVQSRQFERSLELTRVMIGEMVRRDRHADVWEDLIGELGLLEGSIGRINGMIDEVTQRENERIESARKEKLIRSQREGGKSSSIWSFWKQKPVQEDGNVNVVEPSKSESDEQSDTIKYDPLTPDGQDRYTKIIRNTLVAEWFIGDEIKELHKLKFSLGKCIDKDLVHECSTKDGIDNLESVVKNWYESQLSEGETEIPPKMMDLEDRTLIEIIRKLRGDDESSVIDDYLDEIVDIYRIDLYSTGKFEDTKEEESSQEEQQEQKEGSEVQLDSKASSATSDLKPKPLDSKKKLSDLDELKKRFNDLKRL